MAAVIFAFPKFVGRATAVFDVKGHPLLSLYSSRGGIVSAPMISGLLFL